MGKKLNAVIAELERKIAFRNLNLLRQDVAHMQGLQEALRLCLQEQITAPPPVGEWTRDHEGREYFVHPWDPRITEGLRTGLWTIAVRTPRGNTKTVAF